jgi:hypothetical protein
MSAGQRWCLPAVGDGAGGLELQERSSWRKKGVAGCEVCAGYSNDPNIVASSRAWTSRRDVKLISRKPAKE